MTHFLALALYLAAFLLWLRELLAGGRSRGSLPAWTAAVGVAVHVVALVRFARTYGFAEEINPSLFVRLESAGLPRTHRFLVPQKNTVHVDIHEVR